MRARHRGWAAGLLAGVAGLAVIGPVLLVGTASPAAAATTWDVAATNNTFKPNYLNIKPGDRVLWTNQDNTVHSVTSDQGNTTFDTDLGKRGATFERRFDTAGTYTYHCKYHSSMVGTIDVGVPATTTTTAPPPTTTTTVTTAPPTTTTTAPATTTTSEPTTTTEPRPAAGPAPMPAPPVPSSSAAAPPPPPSPTTTSAPSSTTTTTVPPTTATSAPPALAGGEAPAPPPAPATPPTSAGKADTGDKIPAAAGPPAGPGGDLDVGAIALVSALVAVGAFGAWTLIRVRPGRV